MNISDHETKWLQKDGATMLLDIGVKVSDYVIDFGCGEGRYTIPLSQIVAKDGCVYAIDQDAISIDVLQNRLPMFSNNENNVTIVNTDGYQFFNTINDAIIDYILVFDILQYIEDWELFFSYLFKKLKKDGYICIYPAAVPHPGDVDIELVIEKMEKTGFKYLKSNKYFMMHNVDMVEDVVYFFRAE